MADNAKSVHLLWRHTREDDIRGHPALLPWTPRNSNVGKRVIMTGVNKSCVYRSATVCRYDIIPDISVYTDFLMKFDKSKYKDIVFEMFVIICSDGIFHFPMILSGDLGIINSQCALCLGRNTWYFITHFSRFSMLVLIKTPTVFCSNHHLIPHTMSGNFILLELMMIWEKHDHSPTTVQPHSIYREALQFLYYLRYLISI